VDLLGKVRQFRAVWTPPGLLGLFEDRGQLIGQLPSFLFAASSTILSQARAVPLASPAPRSDWLGYRAHGFSERKALVVVAGARWPSQVRWGDAKCGEQGR